MKRLFCLVALVMLLLAVAPTWAQEGTNQRDSEAEQEIYGRLAEISTEAVPLFQKATAAMDAGNYEAARTGYEEVLELAPDFPDALRRLSHVERLDGNIDAAVDYAGRAYDIDSHPYNESTLALALIETDDESGHERAFRYARHAANAIPNDLSLQVVYLMAAATQNDADAVTDASARIIDLAPDEPLGYFYAGLAAGDRGDWIESERYLLRAQELGWPSNEVQSVLSEYKISEKADKQRNDDKIVDWLITLGYVVVGWIIGIIVLLLAGLLLSRLTLATAGRNVQRRVSGPERVVRLIYRSVIALASLYYYISIPLLAVIVIVLTGGIFYGFLAVGRIPIRLAIMLLALMLYTLLALGRSILVRPAQDDIGQRLNRDEAPDLWALVVGVAERLKTRPVTVIFVTAGTEIAVTERGSLPQKIRDRGERCLILGLGALCCLNQSELQAILAHEYGHFSHRDTAGGNLAYQVRASMREMAKGLAMSGQAQPYNPAWLFLNIYHRVFLRITLGASRLQEILADRYAAMAYGSTIFSSGLTRLIHHSLVFDTQINQEVSTALKEKREIQNIWTLPPLDNPDQVAHAVDRVMSNPTSAFDSHPSPNTRIALVKQIEPDFAVEENTEAAEALLPDLASLQARMMTDVRNNIKRQIAMKPRLRAQRTVNR
jgi:Zn-dependent protease with chaperone function